jgi:hypothetical protein
MNVSNGASFITHIPALSKPKNATDKGMNPANVSRLMFDICIIFNTCAPPSNTQQETN